MSGFVALFNLDGAPVDERLLRRLTSFMRFRGPDCSASWSDGQVGFGHTLLRTTAPSSGESQPFTLDRHVWIVGDVRVDGRADLSVRLEDAGERAGRDCTDIELVLRAYRVWGEQAAEHLIGDFAFAIWDGPRRRLFCARDHLGVKSVFYALTGRTLVVSNTLDCVRLHPSITDRLNDLAVADFLLFELNQDPETTVFADVCRLPPAHTGVWSQEGGAIKRYWSVPIDEPVFYERAADYIDRFREVIGQAATDRARTDRVGLFMSGGIDSTTLAAVAARTGVSARAFTVAADGLDRDEASFARAAADRIGIPLSVLQGGVAAFDREWSTRRIHTPAPVRDVTRLMHDRRMYETVLDHSRVCFYGEGPDNALQYEWQPYVRHLVARGRYGRLAADVVGHMRHHRRVPFASVAARKLLRKKREQQWDIPYPEWLNPELEKRLQLRDRWHQYQQPPAPPAVHPVRPAAHASFCGVEWEALFRSFDAEETGVPLEVRHPYLDVRVLRYLLSVPVVPWCRAKRLMRDAMRQDLPDIVLRRQKSGMTGDADYAAAVRLGLPPLVPHALLSSYIVPERIPQVNRSSMISFRTDFRPRALNFWLTNLRGAVDHVQEEREHEIAHA
jgi:asparagine synthase (glutamine-hydrolysing)